MKKISVLLLALLFASTSSFAGVGVKYVNSSSTQATTVSSTTTSTGPMQVTDINLQGSPTSTWDGATLNVDYTTIPGNYTFQSSLIALGRYGASTPLSSSSTVLAPSSLPYSVVNKFVGGNGVDNSPGTTLANGTPGQILVLQIAGLVSGGTWLVTPNFSATFASLTFTAKGQSATLLYDATLGWVVIATNSTIINLRT